jgi:hypothetical protein
MQEQDLKEFYRNVFTLKNGEKIEVLTKNNIDDVKSFFVNGVMMYVIHGFITTPMIIEKTVKIVAKDISAIETTLEPHITWKGTELEEDKSLDFGPDRRATAITEAEENIS